MTQGTTTDDTAPAADITERVRERYAEAARIAQQGQRTGEAPCGPSCRS
jgi:hypothetical protein